MQFVPLTIRRETAVVHLTRGRHALIDADAWPVIGRIRWHVTSDPRGLPYAINSDGVRMHRLICPCRQGHVPDHKNGDSLDNRRANLRPATRQQNCQNNRRRGSNTGYKGAYFDRNKGKYVAKIMHLGKLKSLGTFSNPIDAAKAYDAAAREIYGEFANTNFKEGQG